MKIRLHIERLVFDGLPVSAAQGASVQEALQQHLANAMSAGGLSPELRMGGDFPALRAFDNPIRQSRPDGLGAQIAQSVYGAIGRAK
jgi:hypothetical protein